MSNDNLLNNFPKKRIKPYDGMSVTADVWNQAHEYHKRVNQAHNLFFHGAGILIGLEVVASDPPDRMVFILPGVAVDSNGNVIVLSEPVAYDLGDEVEGPLYLTIIHKESSQGVKKNSDGSTLSYIQDEFLITARQSLPENPMVELARFTRENRKSPINDATDSKTPGINEIDLRYRRKIQMQSEQFLTAAVIYLGDLKNPVHGKGLMRVSEEFRRNNQINLVIDDHTQLDRGILGYSFLYLVGKGKFQLTKTQIKGLQGYINLGGFLFMESCDSIAEESFKNMMNEIELPVSTALENPHSLLNSPNFFIAPPSGYEEEGKLFLSVGGILSTYNYGQLWAGEGKERIPTREELRSASEIAENLIHFIIDEKHKEK
ncbi:MAG: DUF4159 domain-containing protein [Anaerolineaceae bacterium]|nr:DUF4159 domain-containing protein [Anaerolineaceae bacterium]